MNTPSRIGAAALAISMLGACATSGGATVAQSPGEPAGKQYRYVTDANYVKQYEATAMRRSFVHVNWVNLPTRRVPVEDGEQ
jgi:hypothetical protein